MPATMLLDTVTWDLVLDAAINIAVASEPYSLAQDAASAVRTFLGECYWDTTVGVDYWGQILGKNPPLSLLKQALQNAALTVPNVTSAVVYISAITKRAVSGQVQVVSNTGQVSVASFTSINPQVA